MLTVGPLTVLGFPQQELKKHIRGALNVSFSREEVLEIIIQLAISSGFPAVLKALKTAAETFADGEGAE